MVANLFTLHMVAFDKLKRLYTTEVHIHVNQSREYCQGVLIYLQMLPSLGI